MIIMHLQYCIEFEMLPPQLADLQTDPASALGRIIAPLPFAQQQPEKAQSLLELVIGALARDGWLADASPMAEIVEEDEDANAGEEDDAAAQ